MYVQSATIGTNHYDDHAYGGYGALRNKKDSALGTTAGQDRVLGDIYREPDEYADAEYSVEDMDVPDKVRKKIAAVIDQHALKNDFGANSATDKRTLTKNQAVLEQHTNPTTTGISPQIGGSKMMSMTGVTKKFDGPAIGAGQADQAFKTTGNYFYTGTQYGTSRKPLPKEDEDLDPVFNSYDLFQKDPVANNYIKQQNKVKNILNSIEAE
jgi:hypothetical protein